MSTGHIFWDWNGTLLDDTPAALSTLNDMLAKRALEPISMEFYRGNFAFPSKVFYERIGMRIEDSNWDAVAKEYHDIYSTKEKALNSEAVDALSLVKESGYRQSVLSALRQDLLSSQVRGYSLTGYFSHICGTDNLYGSGKVAAAQGLFARVPEVSRSFAVVIGDSIHDKEVADKLGIGCVLCSQGSHSHSRLEAIAPTARTLLEAVSIAKTILSSTRKD